MTPARFASPAACSAILPERQATSPADDLSPSAGDFFNTWIGKPEPRAAVVRDFTFKAVVGEPSW